MSDIRELIDKVKADSLRGIVQSRETMVQLLEIPVDTPEYDYLCHAAFEAAKIISGKEAYLWGPSAWIMRSAR